MNSCAWVLKTGKNAGEKCKSFIGMYGKYCSKHEKKGIALDKKISELEEAKFIVQHGMTTVEYNAKLLAEQKAKRDKMEAEFVARHGMSSAEYKKQEDAELAKAAREYSESMAKKREEDKIAKIKQRLAADPDYQYRILCQDVKEHLRTFLDIDDGYWDNCRELNMTNDGETITTIDGRKFRIAVVEIKDETKN